MASNGVIKQITDAIKAAKGTKTVTPPPSTTPPSSTTKTTKTSSSSSSGGSSMATSSAEKTAANRQKAISKYNANSIYNQAAQQVANVNIANAQNKALAALEKVEAKKQAETDRFQRQRNLQNAALGVFGTLNQAMSGSSVGNMMRMLEDRNDSDNVEVWQAYEDNLNNIENNYMRDLMNNRITAKDIWNNAAAQVRSESSNLSSNLNNIKQSLYTAPGSNSDITKILDNIAKKQKALTAYKPTLSGYVMPDNAEYKAINNTNSGKYIGSRNYPNNPANDYFGKLLNGFNRR